MPELIPVADPDDPRIEAYRSMRERDLAGRHERFIAEGEVVLGVLARRSRFAIESVLLAETRLPALAPLLAELAPPGLPVFVAARAVMDRIVGFPIHRGVLAVGRSGPAPGGAELIDGLPESALVVGLVGLANHDNVGGVFRNAAAFGADAVLVDGATCDPLYRKAIRVSVGASLLVPFGRVATAAGMVDALLRRGFAVASLSPGGREDLADFAPAPRTALLLGSEGPGLPPEILARTRTVSIRMAGGFDSLNVATASGIALHHVTALRGRAG